LRKSLAGKGNGGADRGMRERRRVRPFAALLHVRKLVAERGDPPRGESPGDRLHEGVVHAGAGAMREDKARRRGDRTVEPRGNGRSSRNRNLTHRRVRLEVSGFFHALAFEKRLAWSIPGV